ncbi:methyltransferase domain-containing protein [Bosea sp. (in: a-proteobacteria)]|uniref:methyltransferase domain-containing protein n=1 Tax=Bosea sp. (in: a-proteobacteria) TaxID=1871050 RepID=UPI0026304385|nr:methyltransferase domain-containing protein [Bosea sp. (in: a-proteobacteria)]MCO5093532.1 class I SAM-dependent methyltransferase [Bosea sp. (in: a-proteobacteria)]
MTINPAINPYDAVAYPGHSFAQTHPSRLATIAHFHGMDPARPAAMRVLELGCGRGGNLIPMAAQHPESRFLGIDLSGDSIRQASANAAELGLANLAFAQRDILTVTAETGSFDYIIVHGVYSWVPDAVRERIIALFGELLAPQGVAYVSYNALPGCRLRDIARDVMLFAVKDIAEPRERVRVARATLKEIAEASDPDTFHGAALRQRLKQIDELPDNVLYHDDLNPGARAFALHEVLAVAERNGLQFLAEASFPNLYGAAKGPAQQMLDRMPLAEMARREQTLDLLIGRAFRETLLCRADIPLRHGVRPGALRPYQLAAHVRPAPARDDDKPGVARFSFDEGVQLAVDLPLCKAALAILGASWPSNIAWEELVERACRDAEGELGPDRDHEIARLDEALTAIFKAGLIDIRLEAPPLTTAISERPAASEIARWQASTSAEVTDLRHRTVQLDGVVVRKFVSLLDGSRDQRMLLDAMNAFIEETKGSGIAVPGLPERATAEEVAMHLKDVARLGLLRA